MVRAQSLRRCRFSLALATLLGLAASPSLAQYRGLGFGMGFGAGFGAGRGGGYPPGYGSTFFPPSTYGYNLDDPAPGYYGGGRYREYYNYGRGYGIANFPGPLPVPFETKKPGYSSNLILPPPRESVPSPRGSSVAHVTVEVPADATIWLEGRATKQTGTTRHFVTPRLAPGDTYLYAIRARWLEEGREVDQTKEIELHAGDRLNVKFTSSREPEDLPIPRTLPPAISEQAEPVR